MSRPILLAAAALTCAGCVPFPVYDSPGISGSVQDRASGTPIAGAQVLLVPTQKPDLKSTAVTDAEGHFQIKEITHRVWLPPLPFDPAGPGDAGVTVTAAGFRTTQTTFYKLLEAGQYKPDIKIYLERQ